jgi:hypothetical protein
MTTLPLVSGPSTMVAPDRIAEVQIARACRSTRHRTRRTADDGTGGKASACRAGDGSTGTCAEQAA